MKSLPDLLRDAELTKNPEVVGEFLDELERRYAAYSFPPSGTYLELKNRYTTKMIKLIKNKRKKK